MLPRRLLSVRPAAARAIGVRGMASFSAELPYCRRPKRPAATPPSAFRASPPVVIISPRWKRPFSHTPPRRAAWPPPPRRDVRPLVTADQMKRVARSPRTHTIIALSFLGAVAFYFANVEVVPVSGRRRFNCFSEESIEEVSEMQYKRVLYDLERQGGRLLPDWDPRTLMVRRVMRKLIPVSGMADAAWEVRVIDDPATANAFVLPGGKVFVFSGILPLARNDSGLAAVLGHEIAHNLAEHIAERMSGAIGVNILLGSLLLLSAAIPGGLLLTQFFGGSLLDLMFSRPMSRLQESEADYIGLMMMAEACYDPREAVDFWKRMDRQQELQPPEWISTHPSNQTRIEKIQQWLPKAMEKREESSCQGTQGFAELFRRALQQGYVIGE
ncbi:Peptidase family M48 [Pleurostoma richardsiae]|uniref:Peptidase family M48 n=1 Tax=Pleurostoma richardsiae TaxID=41990 RepID=A0AA38VPV8_9PEZI|nr:Peptidase family M48 [Pleurostoma richardsiae]